MKIQASYKNGSSILVQCRKLSIKKANHLKHLKTSLKTSKTIVLYGDYLIPIRNDNF